MRLAVAVVCLAAAAPAAAHVAVAPFAADGDLALFGPEVGRVVATTLERSVETGSVTGRIEAIDRERVRLRATAFGRTVDVEGELERIDELAVDLAARIVAAVPSSARRDPPPPEKKVAARGPGPLVVPSVGGAPASTITPPAPVPPAAPSATPAPPPAPPPSPPVAPEATARPDLAVARAEPPPAAPPPDLAAPHPPRLEPINPYQNPPPPVYVVPPLPGRWRNAGPPGRTLLHAIGTPEGCALGQWASLGARDYLERRLRIQVTPSSACGIHRLADVAAEASHAGARAVVQAAFDSLRLEPQAGGYSRPAGRLRIVVVRDGRVAVDRMLDLAGLPAPVPDLSRAAYDLVIEGLRLVAGEIHAAVLGMN